MRLAAWTCAAMLLATVAALLSAPLSVDERAGGAGEWGFRPAEGGVSQVNPPRFCWRPQRGAVTYEVQADRRGKFDSPEYAADGIVFNVHCPPKTLAAGQWAWRFRYHDRKGIASPWSRPRRFTLPSGVSELPLPARDELLARLPKSHPRLFLRREDLPRLRRLARGELKNVYAGLVRDCERLLRNPPPTTEPPKYGPTVQRLDEQWRRIWWGNRVHTIRVLNGAATLAFTHLLGGKAEYAQLARRLLMAAAEWDPKGATGYRYNDEAGMPYAYYFARAYTFLHDRLRDAERARCRDVMAVRAGEMYRHLCPRHLWRPYSSHSNRAWHFLGEVAVAFHGEIPDARKWLWFAMNVFSCVYPAWCDDDGGWHEGAGYWRSYVGRFTWWADVMRSAMRIDAYKLPYFSRVGHYAMYLQPPGTSGGGFGDLTARLRSGHNAELMTVLAAQSGNPYWQWYVEAVGGPRPQGGYIGFVRGALPKVAAKPPTDLPTSRVFRGTGQAVLNTNLLDAKDNVEIIFKSSPFGTVSHGYESQNSLLLYAFGERLLIRTGRRDIYGSRHHRGWMWHTRSTNCITVDGESQTKHSYAAAGRITDFHTSRHIDYVAGDAGRAYGSRMKRFDRHILFIKPDLVVIFDVLESARPARFQWHLHAPTRMAVAGQRDIRITTGRAACRTAFLAPRGLKLTQTDRFDPPPRPRVKLTEYHLTAETPTAAVKAHFVTLLRPHRKGTTPPHGARLEAAPDGYTLTADLTGGRKAVISLRLTTAPPVAARILDTAGKELAAFRGRPDGFDVEH